MKRRYLPGLCLVALAAVGMLAAGWLVLPRSRRLGPPGVPGTSHEGSPPAPRTALEAIDHARQLLEAGRRSEAVTAARDGSRRFPSDLELARTYFTALLAAGRADEAAQVAVRSARRDPEARVWLAQARLEQGDLAECARLLEALPSATDPVAAARLALDALAPEVALRLLPRAGRAGSEAEMLRGEALLRTGDAPGAAAALRRGGAETGDATARLYLAAALRLTRARDAVELARGLLEGVAREVPADPAVQYELGRCLLDLKDPAGSVPRLRAAGETGAPWPEVWHTLAASHEALRKRPAAAACRARALALLEDSAAATRAVADATAATLDPEVVGDAAAALAVLDQGPRAIALLQRAIPGAGDRTVRLRAQLREMQTAVRDYPGALPTVETELKDAPGDLELTLARADLLQFTHRYDEAERLLIETRDQNPASAEVQHRLGLFMVLWSRRPDRLAMAEAAYREAIRLQPDMFGPYLQLGELLLQARRAPEAVPVLRQAVDRQPRNPEAQRLLGLAAAAAGQQALSAEAFGVYRLLKARDDAIADAARGRTPADRYRHALLLVRAGRRDQALNELEVLDHSGRLPAGGRPMLQALYAAARRFERAWQVVHTPERRP
jgi:predicted Zn-dependent protease